MEKNSGFIKRADLDDKGREVEIVTGTFKGNTGTFEGAENGRVKVKLADGNTVDVAEGSLRELTKHG